MKRLFLALLIVASFAATANADGWIFEDFYGGTPPFATEAAALADAEAEYAIMAALMAQPPNVPDGYHVHSYALPYYETTYHPVIGKWDCDWYGSVCYHDPSGSGPPVQPPWPDYY